MTVITVIRAPSALASTAALSTALAENHRWEREYADFRMADGVNMLMAQQMAETLDRLYPASDAVVSRLGVTRHVVDLALATMAARGVPIQEAAQTVLAAIMEILVDGLGPAGAGVPAPGAP
ncbi:hypothetical protein [Vineibacter terrae]|uniref:hypothetical protein n=1 Tax=Vineibacter terrae TaxID=2586908 RepID=UPI002E372987|nr:hypothetical protein [Vineibacter terrae]HEX2892309.1 hypothetical protein [Vineibacter terrae]